MPDESGNPTVEESVAGAKIMCAGMEPIVEWMRANGVAKIANNGLAIEIDLAVETGHLRQRCENYKALLIKHGLMDSPKSRYAIPDMPREQVRVAEED